MTNEKECTLSGTTPLHNAAVAVEILTKLDLTSVRVIYQVSSLDAYSVRPSTLDIFEALDINGFATQGMKVSGPVSDSVNVSTYQQWLQKGATGVLSAITVDKLSKSVETTYAISPFWGLDSLYSGVTNVDTQSSGLATSCAHIEVASLYALNVSSGSARANLTNKEEWILCGTAPLHTAAVAAETFTKLDLTPVRVI